MEISVKTTNEVKVIHLQGILDHRTSPEAQEHLNELIGEDARKIIVDFTALDFISSAGLRVLLTTAKQLKPLGGEIRVCNLNDIVREVFEISGFVSIIKVFKSEAEALDGF